MTNRPPLMRALGLTTALALLTACSTNTADLDWDLRSRVGAVNTADAARQATAQRPQADPRGVLSYPGYQVAVAQRGDTVTTLATRVGVNVNEIASFNALKPTDPLRQGEVLALPTRIAAAPTPMSPVMGGTVPPGGIDVSAIATTALDRASSAAPTTAAQTRSAAPSGAEPARHKVVRGETAYSIARSYNVSAKALAEWNGLGADLAVREGQFLIIPTAIPGQSAPSPVAITTAPGSGSPTPEPPSAAKPLPDERPVAANAPTPGTPSSPDLGSQRTAASASRLGFPVQGSIIRGYVKKKNDGIDIAAAAGTSVTAAADGTVAAITADTDQVPILVIRHPDNLLTVYANIDGIKVQKGASVKRGQPIAVVRRADPAFLHFEVRKGFESVDPMPYLQ